MTQAEFNQMLSTAVAQGIVGGTYISQYDGEEIDGAIKRFSNPNLLDNAYWANRDSIINQRELTEYTSRGYSIDRWFLTNKCTIQNNGILLAANTGFVQRKENMSDLLGKPLTFSALTNGGLYSGTEILSNEINEKYFYTDSFITLDYNAAWKGFQISTRPGLLLQAVKLELGSFQTLAHKDASGNWVLNDPPPNKALELAKCLRYFERSGIQHRVARSARVNLYSLYDNGFVMYFKESKRVYPVVTFNYDIQDTENKTATASTTGSVGWTDVVIPFSPEALWIDINWWEANAEL